MLLSHAWRLLQERPDGNLGGGLPNSVFDALLEAWLVHARLLDDFLRHGQSHGRGAFAREWQPAFRSDGFLTAPQREAVNAQVVHLSWKRKRWGADTRPPWDREIRELTNDCCKELLRFFDEVPVDVRTGFGLSRSHAKAWLENGSCPP
jgi:hypothetical protein